MRLAHKGLILVLVPLILACLISGTMFALIVNADQSTLEQVRQRQFMDNSCRAMLRYLCVIDAKHRMDNHPEDRTALKEMVAGIRDVKHHLQEDVQLLDTMIVLAKKRGVTKGEWSELQSMREFMLSFGNRPLTLGTLLELNSQTKELGSNFYATATDISSVLGDTSQMLAVRAPQEKKIFQTQMAMLLAVVIASLVTAIGLAKWFMTSIVDRLRAVNQNMLLLSQGRRLNPPAGGKDEIACLDRQFHSMAAAVKTATDKERTLFENATDIICIFDNSFRLTNVNPACTRLLGYTREELIGTEIWQFVPDDDVDIVKAGFSATRNEIPSRSLEFRLKDKSGKQIELLWSCYWSQLDDALYVIAHDITDKKQAERMREGFLSMVSHDLRSPLSSIYSTYKLLAEDGFGELPKQAKDASLTSLASLNRVMALVNNLLDIGKLEAGKIKISRETVDVEDMLASAAAEVKPVAAKRNVEVIVECSCPSFELDRDRITQVLINLLSNAIKYSPEGTTVHLSADTKDGSLRIRVRDQGRGVPQSHQQAIFERFKQVTKGDSTTGTGLGLPICKEIVEAHSGRIGVDSQPGQGSTFWFVLDDNSRITSSTALWSQSRLKAVPAPARRAPAWDNVNLIGKGICLVALPLLVEVALVASLYLSLLHTYTVRQEEINHRNISTTAADLVLQWVVFDFSLSLRPPEKCWNSFQTHAKKLHWLETRLVDLTGGDAQASELIKKMQPGWQKIDNFIVKAHQGLRFAGVNEALCGYINALYYGDVRLDHTVKRELAPMTLQLIDESTSRADKSPAELSRLRNQQAGMLIASLFISLLVCIALGLAFSRGIARRLQVIERNMSHLEKQEPLEEPLSGSDEIAHLDQYFYSMVRSLRELKRKEGAVFDNAQDVMCSLQLDGTISHINAAGQQLWGLSRQQLLGKSFFALVPDSCRQDLSAAFQASPEGDLSLVIESTVVGSDGSQHDVRWSVSRVGDHQTVLAIGHDISERKKLERLKREFLSMVSHDLRTPLTAVSANTEVLQAGIYGQLPEVASKMLAVSLRSCHRLLNLVNDLLDMEKLAAGQMPLSIQNELALPVLERSVEDVSTLAADKQIKISMDAPADLYIKADANRLVQVMVNLLSNAIKFSQPGSAIVLSAEQRNAFVEFKVQDFGRGIPEDQLTTVFEPYRQVKGSDQRVGTGLGLTICKQILEQHEGEIGVASTVGKGTTFFFRIPAASAAAQQLEVVSPAVQSN